MFDNKACFLNLEFLISKYLYPVEAQLSYPPVEAAQCFSVPPPKAKEG